MDEKTEFVKGQTDQLKKNLAELTGMIARRPAQEQNDCFALSEEIYRLAKTRGRLGELAVSLAFTRLRLTS